ncbi:translocation/assembly module TamB domain-containing protein [Maribacter antarcticus]|uniref:translocation/assembly module TamB domain-containing protein n=1 Tax=Maribacter antarcticus TaxID=505250 RepID=UPI00055D4938|nr:translocation/assembly module TamB [Maribacter antarcticus]
MEKKKREYKWLRVVARVVGVLLLLFIVLVLFVRSPWGQQLIVSELTGYVSSKTNTKVEIDRLFITFSGNLFLEGLYLEDIEKDTLLYAKSLEVNLPISPILFGNEINLKSVTWDGLRANVIRKEGADKFNFDFLIDAFVSQDSVASSTEIEPMQINIGSVDLSDFHITYSDGFIGIESQLQLGMLHLAADKIDLQAMRFELDDLELANSNILYKQTKSFKTAADATETQLPYISVDNFIISNATANYNSIPDAITANVVLGDFQLKLPKADLSKKEIGIDFMTLKNSSVTLQLPSPAFKKNTSITAATTSPFKWPAFVLEANKVKLENNSINYTSGKTKALKGKFDSNSVAISQLNLTANTITYQPENVHLELDSFSFLERSGFKLQNIYINTAITDTYAYISNLNIRTNLSHVNGSMELKYPSVSKLISAPMSTVVDVLILDLELAIQDVFFFQPELAENPYLNTLTKHPFTGNINANGTLDSVQVNGMQLNWGKNTSLMAEGRLNNIAQKDSLSFDFNTIKAISIREDILAFIAEAELGISIPQTILLDAKVDGDLKAINADAQLEIPEGKVQLSGNYRNKNQIRFDGNLMVDRLQLDKLLNDDQLGALSFKMDLSGGGKNLNTLDAAISTDFSQLIIQGYDFSNLELQGKIKNGEGAINLEFKDKNLNFTTSASIELDSIASKVGLNLNLIGADLYALGQTEEKIKTGLQLSVIFFGNPSAYSLNAKINKGIAVYDNQQYQMGNINLATKIDTISTDITIDSDFLVGFLKSNASPKRIASALTNQFKNYFNKSTQMISAADSVKLKMDLKLYPFPILTEVFFRDVDQLDSVLVRADFDETTKVLNATLRVPSATYSGGSIDSLMVLVKGDATNLSFAAGLSSFLLDPINIKKTYVTGKLKNKKLLLDFSSLDGNEVAAHIASELTLQSDTTHIQIKPSNLIFNKKEWAIPEDNEIKIAQNLIALNNVKLRRNTQELAFSNTVSGIEKEHLGVTFNNFKLQTFLSLLNPDEALATGIVNGDFVLENPFNAKGIVADFNIKQFEVLKNTLGNLTLNAQSKNNAAYDLNLAVKDGGVDLDVVGDYTTAETGAKLNLDLDLNRVDLSFIEGLSDGAIKNSHGFISGKISLSGSTNNPEYRGRFNFNETDFNVATFNSAFKISNETIEINPKGVFFDSFKISDFNGNTFTLEGSILTKNVFNPSFDLTLSAKAFRVLNSTKEDNALFYGTASLDADVRVKGNLKLPKVNGKLKVREVTDVTYVVPESQLDIEERDGVVIFVDRKNADAILTRKTQEEAPSFFQGIDVRAVVEIADDATFNVIIDKRTGDNLAVKGQAALALNMEPNGRINLSGRYELKSGHYETNLYNLVKRRFEINPGSTITWQGDPMDAKLDVTAIYQLKTSASPLMSSVTSGQDKTVSGKYRQVLPFLVYLNVDGEILEPKLSFGLDMPEAEQGALGGSVYSRLQQLNQQEAELNKQVFSLLALNRFYPDSGSDGSSGGTAAIARDNVNKVLSSELNAFSDKVFGNSGFEIDFDLDSFTDYQGDNPQDRTQININAKKKLFNDRLIVTAGSAVYVEGSAQPGQEETPIIGNVSLEYLLTKDGKYRLKGFRKSSYENIIDGQLIVTGVALIFNREFNKFSQLFNPLKNSTKPKTENIPNNKNKSEQPEAKNN